MGNLVEKEVGLILGAGFSNVAGVPLTNNIFDSWTFIVSKSSEKRFNIVTNAWNKWHELNKNRNVEQFLEDVYCRRIDIPWKFAVEFVGEVLATSRDKWNEYKVSPRYQGRLTSPVSCEIHKEFWNNLIKLYNISCVVTTNYDLLIERGLRHRRYTHPYRPGFYYGGFNRPQLLRGQAMPFYFKERNDIVQLNDGVPVFKIHGSLNWSIINGEIKFYQDMRPAFRNGGESAIIPPLTEKTVPDWLKNVWMQARNMLSICSTWIVCGYSLPEYDIAISKLLSDSVQRGIVDTIFIIDPYSEQIKCRWQRLSDKLNIICCKGLPEALKEPPLIL